MKEDVRPSNANGKYVIPAETFVGDLPRRENRYATAVHVYQKANEPRGNVIVVGDNLGTIVSVFDDGKPNSGQRNFLDTHDSRLRTSEAEAPLLAMTADVARRPPILDFARVGQILVVATGDGMKLVSYFTPTLLNAVTDTVTDTASDTATTTCFVSTPRTVRTRVRAHPPSSVHLHVR
jgi:hypothetical protein